MRKEDVAGFCEMNNIDWQALGAENLLGAGYLFHWNNPHDAEDGECLHVTPELLAKTDAAALLRHIVNGRDVRHMTRVVGYYSSVSNWNRSKIGELRDRQRGNYAVG